jgi:transcriptional regulator with XRE-family HTH domain
VTPDNLTADLRIRHVPHASFQRKKATQITWNDDPDFKVIEIGCHLLRVRGRVNVGPHAMSRDPVQPLELQDPGHRDLVPVVNGLVADTEVTRELGLRPCFLDQFINDWGHGRHIKGAAYPNASDLLGDAYNYLGVGNACTIGGGMGTKKTKTREPNPDFADVAQEVRKRRQASGLTRAEIAARLGIRPVSVLQWEQAQTSPSRSNWIRFVEITDEAARIKTAEGQGKGTSHSEKLMPSIMEAVMATGPQIMQDLFEMQETEEVVQRMHKMFMSLKPSIRYQIRMLVFTLANLKDDNYTRYESEQDRLVVDRIARKLKP